MIDRYGTNTAFSLHLKNIRKTVKFLEKEEERELFRKYQESGEDKYRDRLFKSHMGLVVKLAKRYKIASIHIEDLVAEGNLGLLKAIEKFDIKKGARLSTYASPWIKAFIFEYIRKNKNIVKVSKNSQVKYNPVISIVSLDALRTSRKEAFDNIDVLELLREFFISKEPPQDKVAWGKHELKKVVKAMETLTLREKIIFIKRRLTITPKELRVLGEEFGMSFQALQQIEARAVKKIKKALNFKKEDLCFE